MNTISGASSTGAFVGSENTTNRDGSRAAPGFMNPEGIIIWHHAAGIYFKKTLDKDDEPKTVSR